MPVQELVKALPWLVVLLLAGDRSGQGPEYGLAGLVISLALGLARWYTTGYVITKEQVRIRRGVLRRQLLTVPRDRLRTVDLTAHVLHRALGLARITLGTGRSDRQKDRGLILDGLSQEDATRIRRELLHRIAETVPGEGAAAAPAFEELARWRPGWILYGPFTFSGAVAALAVVGLGADLVNEAHVNVGRVALVQRALGAAGHSPQVAILVLVLALLLLIALGSTLGYLLSFFEFRLVRQEGTLQIARGLLTHRMITLDLARLRGLELSQPLLLRAVGGARCIAIATGLRVGRGSARGGSLLLPPTSARLARRVGEAVLLSPDPIVARLLEHGPTARRRRQTRVLIWTLPPFLALLGLALKGTVPLWAPLAALAAVALGAVLAWDRYRSLGHQVVAGWLVTRYGTLVRRRCALRGEGIIGWNLHQSFFQRRARVVTLSATTAAGRQAYRMQDLTPEEAVRVAETAHPGILTLFLDCGRAGPT
ncbi:MAG: PH domain-containing protein [Candidatus Dormibacteria bacterium]